MKYFWVKIKDKYDWFEFLVFTDDESKLYELIKESRYNDEPFEILDINENNNQIIGKAIQIRQGCD